MSLGSLLLGALAMYIYLRRSGAVPPRELLLLEEKIKATVSPVPQEEVLEMIEEAETPAVAPKPAVPPGFSMPGLERPALEVSPRRRIREEDREEERDVVLIPKKQLKVPPIDCP